MEVQFIYLFDLNTISGISYDFNAHVLRFMKKIT